MEELFWSERGCAGVAHCSDTRDYSEVSTLTQDTLNSRKTLMSFSAEEHLSLCLGMKARCSCLLSGVGQDSWLAHTESLVFTAGASQPRPPELKDSYCPASLENFLCFTSLSFWLPTPLLILSYKICLNLSLIGYTHCLLLSFYCSWWLSFWTFLLLSY